MRAWPERLALTFALLRGALFIVYAAALFVAPEAVIPGSSVEPARAIGLMFASRMLVFGVAFVVLVVGRSRRALAWLLVADGALQIFDVGMAVASSRGAVAALPAILAVIDGWAARVLLRAAGSPPSRA